MKYRLVIDKNAEEEIVVIAHAPSSLTQAIEDVLRDFSGVDFIVGYREEEMRKLSFGEIECITVLDGKIYAIDRKNQKYRLKERLYVLEERLPGYFMRINKSSIANEKRLERFVATYSGAVDAVFKCGYREYVSRRCFAQIKRRLEGK